MALTTIPSTTVDVLALADLNPEYKTNLDARGHMPRLAGPIEPIRAMVRGASKSTLPTSVRSSEVPVPMRDGHINHATVYASAESTQSKRPVVVLIHGGGLILGQPTMEERNCVDFVTHFDTICIAISYRLAPEATFPTAPHDAFDAVQWIAANAAGIHTAADPTLGFVVCGSSSGAKLADVVLHLARDNLMAPPLKGAMEIIPGLIDSRVVPEHLRNLYLSWEQNKDADILGRQDIDYFTALYQPDPTSTLESPLLDPKGHEGLPPIVLQISGYDPYRDDGLIYGRLLQDLEKKGRAKVRVNIWPGLPHGFHVMEPTLQASELFRTEMIKDMRWLLNL